MMSSRSSYRNSAALLPAPPVSGSSIASQRSNGNEQKLPPRPTLKLVPSSCAGNKKTPLPRRAPPTTTGLSSWSNHGALTPAITPSTLRSMAWSNNSHRVLLLFVLGVTVLGMISYLESHELRNLHSTSILFATLATIAPTTITKHKKFKVAYVTSLTHCNADHASSALVDGAAVLRQSIQAQHADDDRTNYELAAMIALVHVNATACAHGLQAAGYQVLVRDTPVDVASINNTAYVQRLTSHNSGCCAEREFLKLYAYTLTDYDVVVHLDLDVLVLQPWHDLFDVLLGQGPHDIPLAMWPTAPRPDHVLAMFTRDYPMKSARPGHPEKVGVQGGLLLTRPNVTVYQRMRDLVQQSDFVPPHGWGGSALGFGGYFGAAQVQGLWSYYYGHVAPVGAVELHRCYINNMADNPYDLHTPVCSTGQPHCDDCRVTPLSQIRSVHFTFCQKPWTCHDLFMPYWRNHTMGVLQNTQCIVFHRAWHEARLQLEVQRGWTTAAGAAQLRADAERGMQIQNWTAVTYGHCQAMRRRGGHHYIPLPLAEAAAVAAKSKVNAYRGE